MIAKICAIMGVVLLSVKGLDYCLDQYDYANWPGQDVLGLLGAYAILAATILVVFWIIHFDKKEAPPSKPSSTVL